MPGRPKVDPQKIKKLAAQGVSITAIAARTGVSKGAVYGVLQLKKQGGVK